MRKIHLQVTTALLLCAVSAPVAGQETIPELLARTGVSGVGESTTPSGIAPSLSQVLAETDLVVRGVVGKPRGYLSADERKVYTDYPIMDPVILYQPEVAKASRPGPNAVPVVTVTLAGGTVEVSGLTYTEKHEALPPLEQGVECVFLLKRASGALRIAGTYYGAFAVRDTRLVPLTRKSGFALELAEKATDQATTDLVTKLQQLRR